jgi:hypothetical protein
VPPTATDDGDTLDTEITGPVTSDEPPDGAAVVGDVAVVDDRAVVVVTRCPGTLGVDVSVVVGSLAGFARDDVVMETSVVVVFADTSSITEMDELPSPVPSSDPHAVVKTRRQPIKKAWRRVTATLLSTNGHGSSL